MMEEWPNNAPVVGKYSLVQMNLGYLIQQCVDDSAKWFPNYQSLPHQVLCLSGEVGEIANMVKKIVEHRLSLADALDIDYMSALDKDTLQSEIIDVLVYLCNLMGNPAFKDVPWKDIWDQKRRYNASRYEDKAPQGQDAMEETPHE